MVEEFFALKRRHDPGLLFMTSFYSRYAEAGGDSTPS